MVLVFQFWKNLKFLILFGQYYVHRKGFLCGDDAKTLISCLAPAKKQWAANASFHPHLSSLQMFSSSSVFLVRGFDMQGLRERPPRIMQFLRDIFHLSVGVFLVAQSCPTLCDPMTCSLPGSSAHGILQARTLEWVAVPSFEMSSRTRDPTCIQDSPALAGVFFTTEAFRQRDLILN